MKLDTILATEAPCIRASSHYVGMVIDIIGSRGHRQRHELKFGPRGDKTGEMRGTMVAKQAKCGIGTSCLGVR